MVMLKLALTAPPTESVTLTVKVEVPIALGVPVIAPVAEFKVSPTGNAPSGILHV
jgi:hypothetical protein